MSGEDASKVGKADPDFDPELEEKNMTKEQHARAIRADRGGENPEQSLLDALEDYIILCGGEPLEDVSRLRIDIAHLWLPGLGELGAYPGVLGVGKHVCGEATDLAIRCMLQLDSGDARLASVEDVARYTRYLLRLSGYSQALSRTSSRFP